MSRDKTHDSAYDWWFRNRETGKITIGQPANRPIRIFSVLTVVGVLLPKGRLRERLGACALLALAWWAVDETARGVNPYRRMSGAVGLAGIGVLVLRAVRGSSKSRAKRRRRRSTFSLS